MVAEILMLSYFGTLVRIKSDHLPYDVFQSNWIPESQQYKVNMMILVMRTLRPIDIKAANLFELGLTTFLKV